MSEEVLPEPRPETEPVEPVSEEAPPEPVSAPVPPPKEDYASESEDEEPRLTRREVGEMIQSQHPSPKYHYINGMYIKIK
jgi:hypothetical protein